MIAQNSSTVPALTQPPAAPFNIAQAIEDHLPLVQRIARMAFHRFGRNFDHDDLLGYGHLGLVKAVRKYAENYDIRQAIDFPNYVERRVWDSIETGRDQMCHIHRWQWRRMKRGEIRSVTLVRDSNAYTLADAIESRPDEPEDFGVTHGVDEMFAWLRNQKPLWSQVVELRIQKGMSFLSISKLIGRGPNAASTIFRRAMNLLRWKYNPADHRPDDRTARRHKAAMRASESTEQVA